MGESDKIVRDPIHGFVKFSPWERDIIDHPVFQRLRRIRQLALTEMVYPGACHTRFEHSLGVMQVATMMFDQLRPQLEASSESEPRFTRDELDRARVVVRLAALLHDVGHCPFSHAGEEVMPTDPATGKKYRHEAYSTALIRRFLPGVIDHHPANTLRVSADQVCTFLQNDDSLPVQLLFWRPLITGQMDADRADYLLRDSHHAGVAYGQYDIHRLVPGRKLFLGGLEIPFAKGLLGHSDGDCLVHALVDALLGAVGQGDIGRLFPDTDPRFKGIRSTVLLRNVVVRLRRKGFQVQQVDSVIVAEKPKLAPYIPRMKKELAEVKMERDILKKAAAYFARESLPGTRQ